VNFVSLVVCAEVLEFLGGVWLCAEITTRFTASCSCTCMRPEATTVRGLNLLLDSRVGGLKLPTRFTASCSCACRIGP
jgi:hypothetical protein